jgi:hypothetical protein
MVRSHPTLEELLELVPGATTYEIVYDDLEDASLAALAAHPEKILDPAYQRQTSYFERVERDHPDELRSGLERLAGDIKNGTAPRRKGTATVLAYAIARPASSAHSRAAR